MRGPDSDDTPDGPGETEDRREGPSASDEPRGGRHGNERRSGDGSSERRASGRRTEDRGRSSARSERVTIEDDGLLRWFLKTDDGTIVAVRDVVSTVALVALVGVLLFGISGVWPPLVAVESGSMEPNMQRGDLIFVVDDGRFVGDDPIDGTGIVTYENGVESGHDKFGNPGDVIIFRPEGSDRYTPVIHRARFWVEEGENWVDSRANPEYLNGNTCADLGSCPAPRDGFITKGDANPGYDQAGSGGAQTNEVVDPSWVTGKASLRIPWLGHVRLTFDELFASTAPPAPGTAVPGAPTTPQIGLVAIGSAAAIAGSRRPGSW